MFSCVKPKASSWFLPQQSPSHQLCNLRIFNKKKFNIKLFYQIHDMKSLPGIVAYEKRGRATYFIGTANSLHEKIVCFKVFFLTFPEGTAEIGLDNTWCNAIHSHTF